MENAARQKWSLSQEAFDGLLAALDSDRDAAANRYLEIHTNLVRMFEWRGCPDPDSYADETISRCARKIGEGEQIRDVATYCVGIGRMMVRELARDPARRSRSLEDAPELRTPPLVIEFGPDRREECLQRCLGELTSENRDLILRYYQGEKGDKIMNRKGLAELFQIPANTLRMRALRLRERLQSCAEDCVAGISQKTDVTDFRSSTGKG